MSVYVSSPGQPRAAQSIPTQSSPGQPRAAHSGPELTRAAQSNPGQPRAGYEQLLSRRPELEDVRVSLYVLVSIRTWAQSQDKKKNIRLYKIFLSCFGRSMRASEASWLLVCDPGPTHLLYNLSDFVLCVALCFVKMHWCHRCPCVALCACIYKDFSIITSSEEVYPCLYHMRRLFWSIY